MRLLAFLLFYFLTWPSLGLARDTIAGPIFADVEKVRDGDSIVVRAHIWPGHRVSVSVRLRGIDAPELRAKCPNEKRMALEAKHAVERLVGVQQVKLFGVSGGKYFGRVLARVVTHDGVDVAHHLLQHKMVRKYKGGKRSSWCALSTAEPSGS